MKTNIRTIRNFCMVRTFAVTAVTTKVENDSEKVESVEYRFSNWLRHGGTRKGNATEHWPERLSTVEKHAVKEFMAKANRREYEENNSVLDFFNGQYCEYTI